MNSFKGKKNESEYDILNEPINELDCNGTKIYVCNRINQKFFGKH